MNSGKLKRRRKIVKKKTGITLYSAAARSSGIIDKKEDQVDITLVEAAELVVAYRLIMSGELTKIKKEYAKYSSLELHNRIIKVGQKFQLGEKVSKIASGLVFSALADTSNQETFKKICRDDFGITVQTALRYKSIYDAWFSGKFLYNTPIDAGTKRPKNPLDLSVRDLELGASLIVEGEFDNDSANVLFGDGSWLDKKDIIRKQKPSIVKREASVDRKKEKLGSVERKRKERISIMPSGEVLYNYSDIGEIGQKLVKIGFIDVTASDTFVRSIALRCVEILKEEFNG